RYDCEYKRNGTANLLVFVDAHRPWRKVKVTESRACVDFAACMRELVDVHFPKAERIRVVLDNLSTLSRRALPSLPSRRSPTGAAPTGVPLCAEACQLVEYGGDRDRRVGRPVPRSPYRKHRATHCRGRRLGASAQLDRGSYQVDVHSRKSTQQNGPSLPETSAQLRVGSKSQNLCAAVLADLDGVAVGTGAHCSGRAGGARQLRPRSR